MPIDETKFVLDGGTGYVNGRNGKTVTRKLGEEVGDTGNILYVTEYSDNTPAVEVAATARQVLHYASAKADDEKDTTRKAAVAKVKAANPTLRDVVAFLREKFPEDFK